MHETRPNLSLIREPDAVRLLPSIVRFDSAPTLFRRDPTGRWVLVGPMKMQSDGAFVRPLVDVSSDTVLRAIGYSRGTRHVVDLAPSAPAVLPALAPGGPALAPTMPVAFLARVTVQLTATPDVVGETPEGLRINFYLGGGTVVGPKLNGVVEPKGGDWMIIRPDGVGIPHIRAAIRLPDGNLALTEYSGTFDLGPDGYANAARGVFPSSPPLAIAPTFITASESYAWINRLQCLGTGFVNMAQQLVTYDLFALAPCPGPSQTAELLDD